MFFEVYSLAFPIGQSAT